MHAKKHPSGSARLFPALFFPLKKRRPSPGLSCCLALLLCLCCAGAAPAAEPARAPQKNGQQSPAKEQGQEAGSQPDASSGGKTDKETPPVAQPVADLPAPPAAAPAESNLFKAADVEKKARELAARPYDDSGSLTPDFLLALNSEQWNKIIFKKEFTLWNKEKLPFSAQLFHPGFIFNRTVDINIVDKGESRKLDFSPDMFDYRQDVPVDKIKNTRLGFAGFRLFFAPGGQAAKDEVASFLGATYFRSTGKKGQYGLYAKGLALDTASPEGEEFPYFREFWLVKPAPGDSAMTVYALMDSPSTTGFFTFSISPGTSMLMDVQSKLFQRENVREGQKIGLAPMSSMFFYSESTNCIRDDYRPEVHNSDGLLVSDDSGWIWTPLENPERLAVNTFSLRNPRGFGLMQRDDNFDHYQDITARYDRRSSLWVEPQGDWGSGRIELIEIPTRDAIHDNISAFWVPDKNDDADKSPGHPQTSQPGAPRVFSYAYKLYWMDPGVTPHALGRAVATRIVRGDNGEWARFLVDFESEELKAMPWDTGLSSVIEVPEQTQLMEKELTKNPVTGGWRLSFKARLPRRDGVMQSIISAREGSPRLRFRAMLKKGENLPAPLTESWIYDLPY